MDTKMISQKTQDKLDRAAEGLPDEQQWQEINERLENDKIMETILEVQREMRTDEDDDSGEPTKEDYANAQYEGQRESGHTN
jgi:hypothetical protein